MVTSVTAVPPANSIRAAQHFESLLEFETDCWDVHAELRDGEADFVVLDVRSVESYRRGHIPGATSRPHATITKETMSEYPDGTVFVVYCAGPHCNGAQRAAIRLAHIGRPVKLMIGGVTGWLDEGFELSSD